MEKILYFDYCAITIDALVLITILYRKMTKGVANKALLLFAFASLITTIFDFGMERLSAMTPLTEFQYRLTVLCSYGYLLFRNSSNFLFLLLIIAVSRTWFRLKNRMVTIFLVLPLLIVLFGILTNAFHHSLFIVTVSGGYERGPLISVLYVLAYAYVIMGVLYLFTCRSIIDKVKWNTLIMMYVLGMVAAFIQYLRGDLLVEMFSMSIGLLLIILFVQRPEDIIDQNNGILSENTYEDEVRKIIINKQPVQIAFVRFVNSVDVRSAIGEVRYEAFIREIGERLTDFFSKSTSNYSIYYGVLGCFFVVFDDPDYDLDSNMLGFIREYRSGDGYYYEYGARFITKFSSLRYPDDLGEYESIISYSRLFTRHMGANEAYIKACDIVGTKDFRLDNNMAEILERGLKERNFEMYYQPIYSIKEDRFVSAEALIRLKDRDYGYVSPGIFIPAAEQSGFIDEIGNFVIESVYKFVSTHNLKRLGLSYIEVNLSVEQCLKEHFADYIVGTQNEYNVRPERINFEITETAYNSAKDVLDHNIKKLRARGYQFSLDDYGTGYSNMQRVLNLPLKLVKIDKSLVDDLDTENGASIVRNSIKMMQDIKLDVVIEGVETEEQLETLKSMGADYIQGFYFSRPLSELQFLEFLDRHNRREE